MYSEKSSRGPQSFLKDPLRMFLAARGGEAEEGWPVEWA